MTVSILNAAAHLVERSNQSLSNLELQKLLYLAHMFFMGRNGSQPLVRGEFEAWDYGPVHPKLYHCAKIYGSNPVQSVLGGSPLQNSPNEAEILNEAYDSLGDAGPGVLVNITHKPGGAWDRNYLPGVRRVSIPNEEIIEEYKHFGYDG